MAAMIDTRNGLGISTSFEIQKEALKSVGKTEDGYDKFIYFSNVPFAITKVSRSYIADEGWWSSKVSEMLAGMSRLTESGVPAGVAIDSVDVSGGYIIMDGVAHFGGSISETDYGNGITGTPSILSESDSYSGSVSPAGYFPDGTPYYSNSLGGVTVTINRTEPEGDSDSIAIGSEVNGGIVTAVSKSNKKEIGGAFFNDVSYTIMPKTADIRI